MSIASEIQRLQSAKASLKTSINAKTDSSHQITDETIDEYADFVDSIQTGGGGQIYRLPNEYQEVEYIESSGTQYINTGYYANGNTQYEFNFKDGITSGVVFGAYNTNWDTGNGFYHNTSYWEFFHYYSNTGISQYSGSTTSNETVVIDKGTLSINGSQYVSVATKTFTLNYPTYIFAGNWQGARAEQPISCKLMYFKIKENDVLIRDLVPCYRKSDSVIGMYDLVNDEFYTNAGSGIFTKGANHNTLLIPLQDKVVTITQNATTDIIADSGYEGLSSIRVITNVANFLLPLDYIESTGTQYIDADFIPTSENVKFETKFSASRYENAFFGGFNSAAPYFVIGCMLNYSTQKNLMFWVGSTGSQLLQTNTGSLNLNTPYVLTAQANNGIFTVDFNNQTYTSSYITGLSQKSTYIFAQRSSSNSAVDFSKVKLYYFKIYDNDQLVRDFIPVITSDNVACLYDKVSKTCFYNKGTGNFLYS